MKYPLRFGIAGWVLCSAFLFAQSNSSSTEQKQEPPVSSNASPPNTMGADFGPLDGTWEGDFVFLQGATLYQKGPTTRRYRITIQGSAVHVYLVQPPDVREIEPGKFHIERLMTNAVIYATASGHDHEGTWVETQVLAVTLENGNTLLTNFAIVVNNIELPLSNDRSPALAQDGGLPIGGLIPRLTQELRQQVMKEFFLS